MRSAKLTSGRRPTVLANHFLVLSLTVGLVSASGAQTTNTGADLVPADCAFFTSALQVQRQWRAVATSPAVQRLIEVPLVQTYWARLTGLPAYQQFSAMVQQPVLAEAGRLAADGLEREIFFVGDQRWLDVFGLVADFQQQLLLSAMTGAVLKTRPSPLGSFASVLLRRKAFQMPGLVIGFRFRDTAGAARFFEHLRRANAAGQLPLRLEERRLGAGDFLVRRGTGRDLALAKARFIDLLTRGGLGPNQAELLYDWLEERTYQLGIGHLGAYGLIGLGPDGRQLERLGQAPTLGRSPVLEPIRQSLNSDRLIALSYNSQAWSAAGRFDPKALRQAAASVVGPLQFLLPKGFADRLLRDLDELAKDLEGATTPPAASVGVTLLNRGIETFTFTRAIDPRTEYDEPLRILRRAGREPLAAYASASKSSLPAYHKLAAWLQRLYGYWTDFGLPLLGQEDQALFRNLEGQIAPFLRRIEQIVLEQLLPSIDAGQNLVVIDGKLQTTGIGGWLPFPRPMPTPELALACTLKDSQGLPRAAGDLAKAIEEFLPVLAPLVGRPALAEFQIPRPNVRDLAGATMYYYALPPDVDPALLPHAVVRDRLLILSTSPALSQRMLRSGERPVTAVVPSDQPSGSLLVLHLDPYWPAVKAWMDLGVETLDRPGIVAREFEVAAIAKYIDPVFQVVRIFRGAELRNYREGEYVVSHRWLHLEETSK